MDLECGHWRGKKAIRLAPHYNAGVEIVHVVAGHLRWLVEDRVETVRPGTIFVTCPWQRHGGVEPLQPACEIRWILVPLDRRYRRAPRGFRIAPELGLALHPAEQRRIARSLLGMRRHCHPAGELIPRLMPATVAALRARPQDKALCRGLVHSVLVAAARTLEVGDASPQAADEEDAVAEALAEIRVRCAEDWSLVRMAAHAGYGRTRFAERVRTLTGESPVQYLNRCRVERAQQLLETTDRGVTAIALDCGFGSSQYFARVFRSFTGSAASGWRRCR